MKKIILSKSEKGFILVFIFILIFSIYYVRVSRSFVAEFERDRKAEEKYIENVAKRIQEANIVAKSFSVFDIDDNKKIISKNDSKIMPIASLAKVMTVLVSLDDDKPREIVISSEALRAPMDHGLLLGEKWNNYELSQFTLITSSNDGATALSLQDPVFIEKMNIKAKNIGMYQTAFLSATGLDDENGEPTVFSTASDVTKMISYATLTKPEIFDYTSFPAREIYSNSDVLHNAVNTNISLEKIPNVVLSKTGYTDSAQGTLAVVFINKKGHRIAVAILGSTFEDRFTDMEKITQILYNEVYE